MLPSQGQAWRDRWQLINELEEEELRNTSPEVSLRQLNALYRSLDVMGWRQLHRPGEEEVRQRWVRLKEKYGVARTG